MVFLQVDMFSRMSVAMPTFSSQISKLFLPFGRVQLKDAVAWAEDSFRAKKKFVGRNVAALHKSVVL